MIPASSLSNSGSAAVEQTTVESTPYTDFLGKLDSINIDAAAGNATESRKTELRSFLNPKANFMSQILDNATLPLESVTIDRLAKIAFAFSPDPENTYAKRATMILGNALQEAAPQSAFHINARLEQIDSNPARDAIVQAMHRPTFVNINQRLAVADSNMLSDHRQEKVFVLDEAPEVVDEPKSSKPKDTAEQKSDDVVAMLHKHRLGQ